ncbi:UDP-N-acetylmuramoylalanyl-D-glutamyl-2,6-diaminopimelate--D-alanyl-D-alanine ligase [Zavarzinia compransoris]|uniref:UDP-N-acetylmuramoyl-tripeptide--D-alanyl-D-alanine ligase n=1 Tax=Zavarzinia compransoris TaxID=1264899 RepID=A0A317DVZ8_9PROT|nr:UDP-N-acetylmuramoylalanyl-D-glutamyl-2,6-diaminopimelate--D-alanyl-D-alanine ligase [Zavarzinia compransoris]PWR18046.1 UDP-N-acetylmuramoylalanyl-D-glutamyl-2,6-diaminopimelate--D-alanyl-D-alanine ligase [Zavarzinia compransoris]TDP43486.1 UDP-N-acetylmuramoyl-tripeptide--D-alanyl-D-alanine ligase [Zavarzinia compransoris]
MTLAADLAPLWTAEDIAAATGGRKLADFHVANVVFDSRQVQTGDLFVALKGAQADGHNHVAGALARGAGGALVARVPDGVAPDAPLVVVGETMAGLEDLARAARARADVVAIGVTGSVGKTGTKEALKVALGPSGPTHASVGSFNNHVGVPLTLARMPAATRFGVFEMGMNHAGELTPLSRLVRPHIAIVTTVEPAHMAFFESVEAIADAKAEIFAGVPAGGAAVLNRDNRHFERLSAAARARGLHVVGFGTGEGCHVRLLDLVLKPDLTVVDAMVGSRPLTYKIGAPGRHWAMNSLAVMAAVELAGADISLGALALADMAPPAGRGRRLTVTLPKGGSFTLVDESYNASPASMRAAFANLALSSPGPRGRRIAVLGDMRELGEAADALHAGLAPDLVAAGVDLVFTCGPHMRALYDALPDALKGHHAPDSKALATCVSGAVRQADVVVVKGSLGSYMAAIIDTLLRLDSADSPR